MYPMLIKNGSDLRSKLIGLKIYVPLLWPNVLVNLEAYTYERNMVSCILPLPCDQRYSLNDVEYAAKALLSKVT